MQDVIPSTLNYSGCEADRTWALDRFPPPDDIIVQLFELLERGGGTSQTRGTTAHFVRLAAKVALPPKYRRSRR